MPLETVSVITPLRALLIAALNGYAPLVARITAGNKRMTGNEQPIKEFSDPASFPNIGVRWAGGNGSTLHTLNPTFATLKSSWTPAKTSGITQESYAFDVTLTTRDLKSDDAADIYEDAKSAILYAGPKLGSAQVTSVTIGRVSVTDVEASAAPNQQVRAGTSRKRIAFQVNVGIEAQTADLMPVTV